MRWFELFVIIFATASVTRLIAADDITHPARVWITWRLRRQVPDGRLDWCRWCTAFWVALPLATGWWLVSETPRVTGWPVPDVLLWALALRYATGWLAEREKKTA